MGLGDHAMSYHSVDQAIAHWHTTCDLVAVRDQLAKAEERVLALETTRFQLVNVLTFWLGWAEERGANTQASRDVLDSALQPPPAKGSA
jgi:hypothetical protein